MLKARGLTVVAIITLALGIGANTAIFSVVNALLSAAAPLSGSGAPGDRVAGPARARRPGDRVDGPSQHFDWKAQADVFATLTSIRGWSASVAGGDLPESLQGEQVTREYFDVAGTWPALGRGFQASDGHPERAAGRDSQPRSLDRRFGGDRAVIGARSRSTARATRSSGSCRRGSRPFYIPGAATVASAHA
jgi:hypothetical protein